MFSGVEAPLEGCKEREIARSFPIPVLRLLNEIFPGPFPSPSAGGGQEIYRILPMKRFL